jgi:putative salt-induced outer membrane protein YdiY
MHMIRKSHLILGILLVACNALCADQVVLNNGDRLTGTLVKSDGKDLLFKTEYAGEITIHWDAVQGITSSEPLHVGLKNGQSVVGTLSTADGKLELGIPNSGTVETSKADILTIRNDAEQKAWDKSQNPGLLEGWEGGANISFALTRGNSETKNLALAFTGTRASLHDKMALYANTVYATNDAAGAIPGTTANAIQAGIRYDRDIKGRLFGYLTADFQTDALQSLNLRSVPGAGLGFHAIKSEHTTFDLLAGANYTRENYTTLTRNFAAVSIGEELTHKVGTSTVITEKLYFFPNLNDPGEYRGTFNFGTVTKLNKWLGWQNSFGDIYVTNPPAGKRQNDVLLTTGLNFSFTH